MTSISTPVAASTAARRRRGCVAMRSPAVPTAAIARTPCLPGLVDHARDGRRRALDRLVEMAPVSLEALAEPGDLGAVDDRRPVSVAAVLADVELDRVGAEVDDRAGARLEPEERFEAGGVVDVRARSETEAGDRRQRPAQGPLTRPRSSASGREVGEDLGHLRGAAATCVASRCFWTGTTIGRGSDRTLVRGARRRVYVARAASAARGRRARGENGDDVAAGRSGTRPSAPAATARARRRSPAGAASRPSGRRANLDRGGPRDRQQVELVALPGRAPASSVGEAGLRGAEASHRIHAPLPRGRSPAASRRTRRRLRFASSRHVHLACRLKPAWRRTRVPSASSAPARRRGRRRCSVRKAALVSAPAWNASVGAHLTSELERRAARSGRARARRRASARARPGAKRSFSTDDRPENGKVLEREPLRVRAPCRQRPLLLEYSFRRSGFSASTAAFTIVGSGRAFHEYRGRSSRSRSAARRSRC